MPYGAYRLFDVAADGTWTPRSAGFRPNGFLYTWGHLAARCVGRGERDYRVTTIYLEFRNGSGPAPVPQYGPADGTAYYDGLASSPDCDYLRVPIAGPPAIDVAPGYELLLPPDLGNRLTFTAQTGGTQGVHGKPFSDSAGSVVYGVALVATPALVDSTADILLARGYYDPAEQVAKTAGQLGVMYQVLFGGQLA